MKTPEGLVHYRKKYWTNATASQNASFALERGDTKARDGRPGALGSSHWAMLLPWLTARHIRGLRRSNWRFPK